MRHLLEQSRRGRPQTIKFVLVINYFVPTMYKICFLFLYQISYFNVRCRINLRWNRGEKKGRRKLIYKKTHQIVWTPWNIYMYAMCKTQTVVAKYGRGRNFLSLDPLSHFDVKLLIQYINNNLFVRERITRFRLKIFLRDTYPQMYYLFLPSLVSLFSPLSDMARVAALYFEHVPSILD